MLNSQVDRLPLTRRARLTTMLAALAVAFFIASAGAMAQGPFASVTGRLLDPQRAPLAGATLIIVNTATQARNQVRSDAAGHFELVGLPPGDYVLEVVVPGFQSQRSNLTLNGDQVDREIIMNVGTLQETVTVTPGPAARLVTTESDGAREKRMSARLTSPCTTNSLPPAMSATGGRIRPPVKIRDVRPVYPAALSDAQVAGTVDMEATISLDGSVRDVVVTSAAHPALDAAAIDAVRQWEFSETLLNCVPIEVTMKVRVSFTAQP